MLPDSIRITTQSEDQTAQLGADIALILRAGDFIALSGDLGAGKSSLSRSIIRYLAQNSVLEVPSPSYTLCNTYETSPKIAHFDLYRLTDSQEIDELGWEDALQEGSILMEWAELGFESLPDNAVQIAIKISGENERQFAFEGNPDLLKRIKRSLEIRSFLNENGWENAKRKNLTGDASTRSYETIGTSGDALLLMNAPAMTDGPPIKHGKPYSKIVHLAEDVKAFVAIDQLLCEMGFRAPEIPAMNLSSGLLLIENLGADLIIDADQQPIPDRYRGSIEFLNALHACTLPDQVQLVTGENHIIPAYDKEAILTEVELLLDWYAPDQSNEPISQQAKQDFEVIWQDLFKIVEDQPKTLVLRDFHSPNIIWREGAKGLDRIGLIDFQDAVVGPTAYDVASLAQDARVDVSERLESELINYYIELGNLDYAGFDEEAFRTGYAIMAAQRATKVLGIFVRLDLRDGKPNYRKNIPRIEEYLRRSLQHPVLSDYQKWLKSVIEL
ncbi:MAG: tRNA (adenosine(37)-N6)-threonylcarbamoyltransferase complex ATPase subunit type 1 TsaE [Pseudomonadota bacterium]